MYMITNAWIDLRSAIYGRRAVRRYKDSPVRHPAIESLVHAAIQAPSALNRQPWEFVVIDGADRLKALSERVKRFLLAAPERAFGMEREMLADPAWNVFYGAPALVIICAITADTQAAEDCCLAAQNFMLAAYASQLGSCPIGLAREWLALPEVKRELGIPQNLVPVFPVVLGYPDEEPQKSHGRHTAKILWI